MKFNGISMGETPTVFISKLKAKGFTPIYQSDNILEGKFCGIESCTVVVTTDRDAVLSTCVIFPGMKKWEDLENLYIYFKSIKTGKGILDKIKITFKKLFSDQKSRAA